MNNWKDILVAPDTTILKAIEVIDAGAKQIALVVDRKNRLLGTVTDGDIRRGILRGISLQAQVRDVMFKEPNTARLHDSRENIIAKMKSLQARRIPILDTDGCVVGMELWEELIDVALRDNTVVIMAGGLGTRLGELTKDCPKPLLKVGDKPLLETIVENCKEYGFHRFYLSVNYKAEMIESYFGDGSRWGVEISYIQENKRLGTAGALGLLPTKLESPLLVMNGDILTKVNLHQLLDFHVVHQATATMCVREYDFQVPFGVVKMDQHRLIGIDEKPVHSFFVNAGIYALSPEVLRLIQPNSYLDMPSLFERVLLENLAAAAFPVREYWLDIGRVSDYERANGDYLEVFV